MDIEYSYSDVPTIREFRDDRSFIRGLMGPFGSGKSSGCVIELIRWGARQNLHDRKRRARFACIRNTYRQLDDTTISTFHQWVPPHCFGKYLKSEHKYLITGLAPDLEIEVLFRALDRPEHVSNLLSLELTGAWVNEAREVPWAVIRALQGRVGRYPAVNQGGCVDAGIIMDTNPPDDESWWYELFETTKPANARMFRQPSGRAPNAENKRYLPPNYYENMVSGADQEFISVYVDGNYGFVKDGKPIYPEYTDSIHCRDVEYLPGVVVYRGWDFGITPACVFSQVLPGGTWNTFDELTADSLGIETFSDQVLLHCAQKYPNATYIDIGDPAGNSQSAAAADTATCFTILHGKGIRIEPGDQALTLRIGSVKKALNTLMSGKPQLLVHSRCKKLRKGYQGRYQFKKLKITGSEERYHDTPDKNEYSHPHDANQYVAARLFGSAVKSQSDGMKPIKYPGLGIV